VTNERSNKSDDFETLTLGWMAIVTGGRTLDVARVWGGGSAEAGYSWTTPDQVGDGYRDRAGLPDVNTAQCISMGTVDDKNIILRRAALPLDGNKGGMSELIINPASVNITGRSCAM
jgi:hypothetical protein